MTNSKRLRGRTRAVCVAIAGLVVTICVFGATGVCAQPSPEPSPSASPPMFPSCDVGFLTAGRDTVANASAKSNTDRLVARLFLLKGYPTARNLAARLILVSDEQILQADVPELRMETTTFDAKPERRTSPIFIALPSAAPIRYVYVESYAIDGAPPVDCPIEVSGNSTDTRVQREFPSNVSLAAIPVVTARVRQTIASLPCGKVHEAASVTHAVQPHYVDGLTRPAMVQIEVVINATGSVVKATVYKSSGIDAADAQADFAAYASTYKPATFLCQPVPGAYLFTSEFVP